MIVPLPRQRGHGCESAKKPWLSATTPRPPHCGQIFGAVPGFAPEPSHVWQATSSATGIFVSTPVQRVLEREVDLHLDVGAALRAARAGRRRRSAAAEDPAEEVAEVAEVDALGRRPVEPAAARARAAPFVEPKRSYCFRFSGSERTS